jgi:site-specific recombinase XerD
VIDSFQQLVAITADVLTWAMNNGAKLFWIKAIRTALSVLFNYKFNLELSQNAIIKSLVQTAIREQPPIKTPLQLTWELPQLMEFIRSMPMNARLKYPDLQGKCVVLLMICAGVRFTEMLQFMQNSSEPEQDDKIWKFIVQVKGKPCRQPIAIHRMTDVKLDPIQAMKELRKRMKRKRCKETSPSDTFWRNEDGTDMTVEHLRRKAQELLRTAGIRDTPYHIKHATISWLYKQGKSTDEIIRFIRHAQSSTTFIDYYLNEDLGASCSAMIETTTTPNRREQNAETNVATTWVKHAPQGRRTTLRASKK